MRFVIIALVGLTVACSSPAAKEGDDTGVSGDAASGDLAVAPDVAMTADAPETPDVAQSDTAPPDLPVEPAYCDSATAQGFFPTCEACDANGLDCDTIDAPNASGRACGCGGGCPCGLHCGSYEIAPNVVVSDICVR